MILSDAFTLHERAPHSVLMLLWDSDPFAVLKTLSRSQFCV